MQQEWKHNEECKWIARYAGPRGHDLCYISWDASQKVCQIRTERIDIIVSSILPVRLAKNINMVSKQQRVEISFYLLISFDTTRRYVGSCEV
jgi:hypothetical protein